MTSTSTVTEFLSLVGAGRESIDVVVIGQIADMTQAVAVREVSRLCGDRLDDIRIIVLTSTCSPGAVMDLCADGAHAVLAREAAHVDLAAAIETTSQGRRYVAPDLLDATFQHQGADHPAPVLTTVREREVLAELAAGRTNSEISKRLLIGTETVKSHLNNIYDKLDVRRRLLRGEPGCLRRPGLTAEPGLPEIVPEREQSGRKHRTWARHPRTCSLPIVKLPEPGTTKALKTEVGLREPSARWAGATSGDRPWRCRDHRGSRAAHGRHGRHGPLDVGVGDVAEDVGEKQQAAREQVRERVGMTGVAAPGADRCCDRSQIDGGSRSEPLSISTDWTQPVARAGLLGCRGGEVGVALGTARQCQAPG